MDPQQALDILEQMTPQIPTTLPNHRLIRQALEVLAALVPTEPEVNGKTDKRPARQGTS